MAKQLISTSTALDHTLRSIFVLRGQKILLDADLAALYGVETRQLNQQIRRNRERFPGDFVFDVTQDEIKILKSQFVTSSWGGTRKAPLAFTEHGAIMAATVLKSPRAVEMSVYVVRAFVHLRNLVASNKDLAHKLAALEQSLGALDRKTQRQFRELYDAIRDLMNPPTPKQRPIGFTADIGGA